jgi:hypothetical protein
MFTGELHKYKDKDLLKDYFFNEYEKDEHPETYALLTHTMPYGDISLLAKKRVNHFDEVVERLPEGELNIYNARIANSNFYYKAEMSAVNLNKKYPCHTDDDPGTIPEDHQTNRYDAYNQLSYNTKLGFLYVTPYTGIRQTFYDRDLDGDESQLRGTFYTGVDVSTKFYKIFHTQASPFGMEINDLRHIITPTFGYSYIPPPTMNKDKVFQFDGIDGIDRKNLISLGLENRLQTKRGKDAHSVDLATLLITTDYDFQHTPGTQFLDYKAELELKPFDWLVATSDAVFDSHKRYHHEWLKEINNDLSISPHEKWSFGLGHRYTHDSHSIILQNTLGFINGWKLKVYEDFDFKGFQEGTKKINDLREQEYVLTRQLHCWEMDIRYNVQREGGETIMVVFKLKAFPDVPFEFGKSYHRPKVGSQSY